MKTRTKLIIAAIVSPIVAFVLVVIWILYLGGAQ